VDSNSPKLTIAQRRLVAVSTMLATLIYTIDSTIANVALPHMQGSLQATQDQVLWVLTSYIVASALFTPATGYVALRFGARHVLLASVAGFTIASMLCGIATSLPELVTFRILQGIAGAALVPISQSVILSSYSREEQGMALAFWGMGVMIGPVLGPTLGGYLTETFNWRWVFFINLPVGALALLGIAASVPAGGQGRATRAFDFMGYLLLAGALGSLQLCIDRGSSHDWFASPEIATEGFLAVVLTYMFVVHSMTAARPFFERSLFRDRNFVGGVVVFGLVFAVFIAAMALLPTFLQQLQGYPVIETGLLMAPRGVGMMVSTFIAGRLMSSVDPRRIAATGLAALAITAWPMMHLTADIPASTIAIVTFCQGVGMGLMFPPMNAIAFLTLPPKYRVEGTVVLTLARNVGGAIAISLLGAGIVRDQAINQARLVEHFTAFDSSRISTVTDALGSHSTAILMQEIMRQASVMAYNNAFSMIMVVTLIAIPAVFVTRRARRSAAAADKPVEHAILD
jgi:DHA2 family multidrug resistance protein